MAWDALNWLGNATGYTQHNINNPLLKDAMSSGRINEEQYKKMGGYDVAQNMPLGKSGFINKAVPVGLASGAYQLAKKGAGVLDKYGIIDDSMGMSKYGNIGALESMGLNVAGSQGLSPVNKQTYESIIGQYKPVGAMYPGGEHELSGINNTNVGNKYANLADEAWANKQTIRTPGGEIVVDTESGQVAPDIAGFPGDEIQETETVTDPDWDRHMRMINSESAEEEGILAPNKWQQFLSKYTRQPYRGAQRHTRDFTPAQLNRMNALGGWYSEPARQQRRDRRSVATLLARKAAAEAGQGTWTTASQKNLNLKTMGSRPGHYDRPGGDQTPRGTDTPASGPGGWGPGAARGGVMGVF